MAQKKKKKKSIKTIDKQAVIEKEERSSDSAIGWVLLMILFTAALVMVLVHVTRAAGASKAATAESVESAETQEMPEDAQAFEAFEEESKDESESFLYADISIQDYGTVTVQLYPDAAPLTVKNFVSLAQSGFYDGLTFHRIINGFMMQGGDPTGTGTGGSDDNIKGEFSANGWDNPLSHTRGAISMARAHDYDSASSQFFICQEDCAADLDGLYACFGYVTEGMEYVDAICADAKPVDPDGSILEADQPVISSIVIRNA